ncbi:MAG: hypothetical protein ACYTKD_17535 [Planctomycetota bacterium]|jgi:Spy/CpxP family protein refolding chaperone
MSKKDGLLAGGVVAALVLSFVAFLSHPGEAPEPPKLSAAPPTEVPAELERKVASVEARVRRIEDALGRLENRLEKAVEGAGAHRRAERRAREPEHAAAAVPPRAAEPVALDELRRMGIDIPDFPALRGVGAGGGDPTGKLAKALDLTADQRARVREILDEFKETVDDRLPGGRGVAVAGRGGGMAGTLREFQTELKGRIAKVLDDEQRKKLDALVAAEGLPIAGTTTLYRIREAPGGGTAVTATSVRSTTNNVRIELRTDDAGAPPPPPAGGDVGDPAGVF